MSRSARSDPPSGITTNSPSAVVRRRSRSSLRRPWIVPPLSPWPTHRVVAPIEQVDFDPAAKVVVAPAAHQGGDGAAEGLRRDVLTSRRVGSETDWAGVRPVETDVPNTADPYGRGAGRRALTECQHLPSGSFDRYLAKWHASLQGSGSQRAGAVISDCA